jgi:L-asparaginase / beta-aspartyl-peptidase
MLLWRLLSLVLASGFCVLNAQSTKWAIAVHGGAGSAEWEHMDPKTEQQYHASLGRALASGVEVLKRGGKALDAAEKAVNVMEDDPLFNAGKGAAFNAMGQNEMDAAIMDGSTLAAGSVAGVSHTKNPVSLARTVMEQSPYVLMVGPGADAFAVSHHLPQRPASYFFTEMRWQELLGVLKASGRPAPKRPEGVSAASSASFPAGIEARKFHYGTTGVVVRDRFGNLAAATSTGGMQGKLPGRVGDSPIIGAGTYASNQACAVSATGVGEYFIRLGVAKEICSLVRYRGMTIQQAASEVINNQVAKLKGGEGGVIVLDRQSAPTWSYNTLGMFRARQSEGESTPEIEVAAKRK